MHFSIGKDHIGQTVHVLYDEATIMFFDGRGTKIITHPRPPKGTNYVGNNKPRGFMANQTSTKS